MGWFSFIILLCYSSYPGRVKKLEKKIKKLTKKEKGEYNMSSIISKLVGEKCKIKTEEALFLGSMECYCAVLEADDEWIKISYSDKKGNSKIKILRIESINDIELDVE